MDLDMPIMSGFESCRKIKAYFKQQQMFQPIMQEHKRDFIKREPVIVALSASDYTPDLKVQCMEAGFDDYFT